MPHYDGAYGGLFFSEENKNKISNLSSKRLRWQTVGPQEKKDRETGLATPDPDSSWSKLDLTMS